MNKDKVLIQRIKAQDQKALREVYENNRQAFLDFSVRYKLGREDVLDIYQDAIVVFYENARMGKLDQLDCSVSTYIFAIGKYKIFARIRKDKFELPLEGMQEVIVEMVAEEQADEAVGLLQGAFSKLGNKCKEILTLFYYEGKKLEEIHKMLNYTNKDVLKSQKSRCLKQLKEMISNK